MPESPCFQGEHSPLPIVIDRRGVFFCRSTATRQQAFQYRNAVIRELADLHSKLRPAKMAEIHAITEGYRKELRSEKDSLTVKGVEHEGERSLYNRVEP